MKVERIQTTPAYQKEKLERAKRKGKGVDLDDAVSMETDRHRNEQQSKEESSDEETVPSDENANARHQNSGGLNVVA